MMTLYKTTTMKDASEFVVDTLRRVDKTNLSVMHTVIVPDRASLEAEAQILSAVGCSFNVQVKTFSRLAKDVLPKIDYLSKQTGIMALSGIIADNKEKLCCYKRGVNTPGFACDVYDTIGMLKYCKISPEQLLNAELPKGLSAKVADIALLYRAFLDFTENRFVDSADKLTLLEQALPTCKQVTNGYFYLYDFDNFSAQELAIIEQLMLLSKGVTVSCCASDRPSDRFLYLNDIFDGVLALCQKHNAQVQIITDDVYKKDETGHIGKYLFRSANASTAEGGNFLELHRKNSRADEVYELACRICKYVRSGGRYRDVFVVTSDITKYSDAIATIFPQFEINYFCDNRFCLADHPYARFVVDYLTLQRNNFALPSVLSFVKNYLFCGKDESVYAFENYCLKYNVSHTFSQFKFGQAEPMFDAAEKFRQKFWNLAQSAPVPKQGTAAEFVQAVRNLISASALDDKNAAFEQEQKRFDQSGTDLKYQASVTAQAPQKLAEVLVQAETVIGSRQMTLDEFIKTISAAIASINVSVIPVSNDCVVFANMAKARKHNIKFLALLGANYGEMPIIKPDGKLFSDDNIQSLCDAGIAVEPKISTENRRERFSLFQLLTEPTEHLYVSYPIADGAATLTPSPFVDELKKLFTACGNPIFADNAADETAYTSAQALGKVVSARRKLKDNEKVTMPTFTLLNDLLKSQADRFDFCKDGQSVSIDRGDKLYFKNQSTSVSQLTDFYKCPYKFYVEYGLNVKPRTVAELKSADLGNILHAVLEFYVKEVDVKETDEVTEQKANHWFDEAVNDDFYRALIGDVRMRGLIKKLRAESIRLCKVVKKQLANSEFANLQTEMAFGGSDGHVPPVEITFDGGKFLLVGKIDRVDNLDDKFIVIDYKSGETASQFSEKNLYIGQKMQLAVYMKAVIDKFGMIPVGFYYFNLHDKFTDPSEDKIYFFNGRTLRDAEIVAKLDTSFAQSGISLKLGIKTNSDGKPGAQNTLSQQQIYNQVEYATEMIQKAGSLMCKGYAAVNPYDAVCDYCDYKCICDMDDVFAYPARKVSQRVGQNTIDSAVDGKGGDK